MEPHGWRLDACESLQTPILISGMPVRVLILLVLVCALAVIVAGVSEAAMAVLFAFAWLASAIASKRDPAWWQLFTESLRLPARWL